MFSKSFLYAGALSCAITSVAVGDTVLGIDVNALAGDASGVNPGSTFSSQFSSGSGYVGTFTFYDILTSSITDVSLNGVTRPGFFSSALYDVSGSIDIDNNNTVEGGFLSIIAWDDAAHSGMTEYRVSVVAGLGSLTQAASNKYSIEGLTFGGMFLTAPGGVASSMFAGADVSAFTAVQPLFGSFREFFIDMNNTSGSFTTSQLDMLIVIPLPSSAGLALAGLFGMGFVRNRR